MTRNQLAYYEYKETQRSNLANEQETNRANVAREVETNRHNVSTEKETNRHNLATEEETHRHNKEIELLTSASNAEQQRHNMAVEANDQARISISQAQLELGAQQLAETIRSNIANEQIRHDSNAIGWANAGILQQHYERADSTNLLSVREGARANMAREDETHRANVSNEQIQQIRNYQDALGITNESRRIAEQERHNRAEERNYLVNTLTSLAGRLGAQAIGGLGK